MENIEKNWLLNSGFFFNFKAQNENNMNISLNILNAFLKRFSQGNQITINENEKQRLVYPRDMDTLMNRNTALYQRYKAIYSKIAPWMFEE